MSFGNVKNKVISVVIGASVCVGLSVGSSASFADVYQYRVSSAAYYDHAERASNLTVGKRYHRKGRSRDRSALGYLVGGVIIGSILADRKSDDRNGYSQQYEQPRNEYWVDKYGDCFRLERRDHGDVYVQTYRGECY